MKNLQLKIAHSSAGYAGPSRLCGECIHGLVIQGEGMNFAWCGYMNDYVSIRVESCNRFSTERPKVVEESVFELLSTYTLD